MKRPASYLMHTVSAEVLSNNRASARASTVRSECDVTACQMLKI